MHPVLHLGDFWWIFFHHFRHRSWLFRLDRYSNARVRRFRFCVLLRFGTGDGMAWYGMDMNMLLNKMCCRYLFSCEKKRETTGVGSHFYALHQLCFLFLLFHKNMTRWLDPTRTFFWGSDSQRSIIYVRGKCIDVTDRQETVGGFGRRWSESGGRFHM